MAHSVVRVCAGHDGSGWLPQKGKTSMLVEVYSSDTTLPPAVYDGPKVSIKSVNGSKMVLTDPKPVRYSSFRAGRFVVWPAKPVEDKQPQGEKPTDKDPLRLTLLECLVYCTFKYLYEENPKAYVRPVVIATALGYSTKRKISSVAAMFAKLVRLGLLESIECYHPSGKDHRWMMWRMTSFGHSADLTYSTRGTYTGPIPPQFPRGVLPQAPSDFVWIEP